MQDKFLSDLIIKQEQPINEYSINSGRAFNQWTRSHEDTCEYENQLRIASKPMKYYVNQFNTPQVNPFLEYTTVGNQKQYNVQNEFQYPLPSRLNPIYPTYVLPLSTSPNYGATAPSMMYSDTESMLRLGSVSHEKKSAVSDSEIEYNRWDIVDPHTVQNAGQFAIGGVIQASAQGMERKDFDPFVQNNVLFANSAFPYYGISSRNELHNFMEINKC